MGTMADLSSGSATIRRPVVSLLCFVAGIGVLASMPIDWAIFHGKTVSGQVSGPELLGAALWLILGPILGTLLVFRSPLVGLNLRGHMVSIRSFLGSKKLPTHAIVAIRSMDVHIGKVAVACPGLITRWDVMVPITPLARFCGRRYTDDMVQRNLEQLSALLSVAIEYSGTDVGECASTNDLTATVTTNRRLVIAMLVVGVFSGVLLLTSSLLAREQSSLDTST
jgi:hypothetical protein